MFSRDYRRSVSSNQNEFYKALLALVLNRFQCHKIRIHITYSHSIFSKCFLVLYFLETRSARLVAPCMAPTPRTNSGSAQQKGGRNHIVLRCSTWLNAVSVFVGSPSECHTWTRPHGPHTYSQARILSFWNLLSRLAHSCLRSLLCDCRVSVLRPIWRG